MARDHQTAETSRTPSEGRWEKQSPADKTMETESLDRSLIWPIIQAVGDHQFDRALKMLGDIRHLKLRAELADYIYYDWAKAAMKGQEFKTARQYALEVHHPERRLDLFLRIASELTNRGRRDEGRAILIEAEAMVSPLPASSDKARCLLRLAADFLAYDMDRALKVLKQAVIVLNNSEAVIEYMEGPNFLFDFDGGYYAVGVGENNLTPGLERLVSELSKLDPQQTAMTVASLDKPELRLLAQIALARGRLERRKQGRLRQRVSYSPPMDAFMDVSIQRINTQPPRVSVRPPP